MSGGLPTTHPNPTEEYTHTVAAKRTIGEGIRDEVVRMYLAGSKLNDIEEATGVPRGSVYWILKQRKVDPARTHATARMNTGQTATQTIEWAFNRLLEQERLVAELERENAALKQQLLTVTPPEGIAVTKPSRRAAKPVRKA